MEFVYEQITAYVPTWLLVSTGFILSFIITFMSIPALVSLANAKGLYDIPNGRTSHIKATPYLGGVAVFTSIILSTVIFAEISFTKELIYIVAGLIILLFVGLKDDMLIMNPKKKLGGQLIASGIIVVLGNIRIDNFQGVLGLHEIPYIASILFTVFVFIVIVNGINLIDGIDGLASGIGIVISFTLGYWFVKADILPYAIMCFTVIGSLSSFFYFNVFSKKNKIFLGDTGSLIVGLCVAVFAIQFLVHQVGYLNIAAVSSAPAVAFGILIIPLFDSLRVFLLRASQGRSPFSADRQHLHHILLDLGFSHLHATMILISINLLFIFMIMALNEYSNSVILIILQIVIATGLSYTATRILKRKREKAVLGKQSKAREIGLPHETLSESCIAVDKKKSTNKSKMQFFKILDA